MARLLLAYELFEPLRARIAEGLPVWGTCAGAILLAQRAAGFRPTLEHDQRGLVADLMLDQELALLPYRQRMAFVLHEQEDMSHAEIAGVLDEKVGTVRWLLFRAREQLRDRLADLLEDGG